MAQFATVARLHSDDLVFANGLLGLNAQQAPRHVRKGVLLRQTPMKSTK
jgi:hypothetical protein